MNNTIVQNTISGGATSQRLGSGIYGFFPSIINCVVRYNIGGGQLESFLGPLPADYSCVPSGTPGNNNVFSPPGLIDRSNGDFRLLCLSACVDAGSNAVATPLVDIERDARRIDGDSDGNALIDIGADEFDTLVRLVGVPAPGRTVRFTAPAPPARAGDWFFVLVSGGDGAGGPGIQIPGSGGRHIRLDLDAILLLWLNTPAPIRQMSLAGCPGAAAASFTIPQITGRQLFFAGFGVSPAGTVTAVTPTRTVVIQ